MKPKNLGALKNLSRGLAQGESPKLTQSKIYKPQSLSRKLIIAIFALMILVQCLSIAISAVFLNESHKDEAFVDLENYANYLANHLSKSLGANLSLDLLINAPSVVNPHYRISIIDLDGKVIFDNKINIAKLDNHLHRAEVQNLLQGKSPKVVRLSDSQHKEILYFTRFIKLDLGADSKGKSQNCILRVSKDKDSLLSYLRHFAPLFATLLIFSVILSVVLGILLTRNIIKPIKSIDLSHPIRTNPYAELHIFMQRISKQKKKIKKQLKRIKQSKIEFDIITRNMNEGFLVLDSLGNITQCNAKTLQLLKIPQNSNVFNDNADFSNAINESIKSNNQAFELNINEYFLQVICMPIQIKDKLKAIIILLFDKSQQRDILALRREFSANVTHELKTPLSAILLSAEMLMGGLVAEDDKDAFVAKIYAESQRLLTLIEKILKISFLEEGKNLEKECVNLANVVRQILPSVKALAQERGIKIECDFGEFAECKSSAIQGFEILGIPALLEDMVYNLCENAIKYSGKNGVVKIILEREKDFESGGNSEKTSKTLDESGASGDNSVVLRVVDNGIGIAPNECERIFERFYCVDKSRSKNLGGNGLGLAIVKRIAKIHNAKIAVHSELGRGSEFVVRFLL